MNQLKLYGPCIGPEGYSEVTRGFCYALDRLGWNIKLEVFDGWGPWKVTLPERMQKTLNRCVNNELYPQKAPIPHLQVCLPEQVKPTENHYNINLTMFEADRIPKHWVESARCIDRVVVPNEFCSLGFKRSGIPKEKLSIVPLGFDPLIFNSEVPPLPLTVRGRPISSFPIRIASILEVTNRKNFAGLLQMYFKLADCFGPENCCLILKAANYSTHLPLSEKIAAFRMRFSEEGTIRGTSETKYNVVNYAPVIPANEMGAFMRCATHYLSMSLAEGWDLNCLNAMACGVPVIVPNHSGYTAYCNHAVACLLPTAKKINAEQQGATGRLYCGASWFAPDADEAYAIAASYIASPDECARRASNALQKAHRHFTWERCAEQLERVLAL